MLKTSTISSIIILLIVALSPVSAQNIWTAGEPIYGTIPTTAMAGAISGRLYAGSLDGRIFESNDGGQNWQPLELQVKLNDFIVNIDVDASGNIHATTSGGDEFISSGDHTEWTKETNFITKSPSLKTEFTTEAYDFRMDAALGILRSISGADEYEVVKQFAFGVSPHVMTMKSSNEILVGTSHGRLLSSKDYGESWNTLFVQDDEQTITSIVTENEKYVVGTYAGIYLSQIGSAWESANPTSVSIRDFAFGDHGSVYIATLGAGVFRSADYGMTWTSLNANLESLMCLSIASSADGVLYAGTVDKGLFKSEDSGLTWNPVSYFAGNSVTGLAFDTQDTLLVSISRIITANPLRDGIYYDKYSGYWLEEWTRTLGGAPTTMYIDHSTDDIYVAFYANIYRTTAPADTIGTWSWFWWRVPYYPGEPVNYPKDTEALTVTPNGHVYAGGWQNDTLYQLIDTTWTKIAIGAASETVITGLASDRAGKIYAALLNNGIKSSIDAGQTWQNESIAPGTVTALEARPDGMSIYVGTNNGIVYHSTDNTLIINALPSMVTHITPSDSSHEITLLPDFYWTKSTDPDPGDNIRYRLKYLAASKSTLYVLSDTNSVRLTTPLSDNTFYYWSVIISDDHGGSVESEPTMFWTDTYPEPPFPFLAVSPANDSQGLSSNVVFIWNIADDPDPLDFALYNLVYATDWADLSTHVLIEGIEDSTVSVSLNNNTEYFWLVEAVDKDGQITRSNNGTPMRMVVGTLGIDVAEQIPTQFALHPNYPNPFNPATQIEFDLPKQVVVSLKVYDIMGKEVATLIEESMNPGYHHIVWHGRDSNGQQVPSGIYIAKLVTPGYIKVVKMALLK